MFVLRLLLMLVVTGERYGTSPVNRRKLFGDESDREDDNAMWNDAYFDRLFGMENRAELPAPVNNEDDEAEEPEEEEDEEYETEDEAGDEKNEEEEEESQYRRSTGERLSRYKNFDYENAYGEKRRDRGKFKREDIVRADDEEECDDGATETLQYFDYDPSAPKQPGEDGYDASSGESRYFRGVSDRIEIIVAAAACFLLLIG